MNKNRNEKLTLLYTESEIQKRVKKLVDEVAYDFGEEDIVAVGLLKGSFIFLSDLARYFHAHNMRLRIDFMTVSSYGTETESSKEIRLVLDITMNIKNRKVLLIDDILDTGHTLDFVSKHLLKKEPALLKTCVFLDKSERRIVPFQADYVGFSVPDAFIVGYGLDYDSRYRELPHLSILSFDAADSKKEGKTT